MSDTDRDFIFICHADLPWTPSKFTQGVEVKNLGKANDRAMQLVRFQPGASFPAHLHADVEFLFMLEGEVLQNGHKLHAGCSTVAPAGTYDTEFISPSGCTFLLIYALSTSDRFNAQTS
ncbi:ChrR-like protein with cupin domain [Paucimonas lemoignei]|uniref:ChrR-like protein with cupin domain n=1 Tax=Paucimonas lemoignei TaxID=29443 RepID=A0A4R3HU38_PAULE|nr:cupin domain-containing protein [Paucimonas lemoignei]TCS33065.1 ChrR-like protein with cupin domain [Paucimonas lemoignei]